MRRTLWLFALLPLAVRCDGASHRDFDCELAVGHLSDCCPDFRADYIQCSSSGNFCSTYTFAALRTDESQCILGLSCDEIIARDLCTKVTQLGPAVRRECKDLAAYDFSFSWGTNTEDNC